MKSTADCALKVKPLVMSLHRTVETAFRRCSPASEIIGQEPSPGHGPSSYEELQGFYIEHLACLTFFSHGAVACTNLSCAGAVGPAPCGGGDSDALLPAPVLHPHRIPNPDDELVNNDGDDAG